MADGSVKIDITADDSDIKKKLSDTEDGLDSLEKKQEESQKKTEETTSKYKELTDAIEKQEKELASLKGEYTQAVVNFGKGSKEAKELEGKMSSLNSKLAKNKGELGGAEAQAKKLSDALEDSAKSSGVADVAIGTFIANGVQSLISKVGDAIGSIVALADETREYREDMAKLETAFTTAGHSTETANEAYSSFYKILGESDRSVEAVNHLAELTKNEEEVAKWGTIAAGVTAKFGDSLPIEGLTEAANETAKVGQVTGPLADALNWAGISEDEFNEKLAKCNSEQERATLITNTLNGEYAAAAEEYNKLTANTQAARDATNNMEQAQAALGAAIEPVTTAWTNMKANALQWLVDTGLPALQTGWQWIQDNLPAIGVIVGGVAAAWLAFGGAQTILNAVQTAGIAIQTALNAVMNANPIGLIILAITALVAAFMILWNNCEGFRNFWIGLWEKIKEAAGAVADWFKKAWAATLEWFKNAVAKIKEFFSKAWEGVKNAWGKVKEFFAGVWDKIAGVFSAIGGWFSAKFTEAKNAILSVFSNIKEKFNEIKEKIFSAFSSIKDKFLSIGTNIVNGIWDGINKGYEWIKKKISEWVGNVLDFCKSILGIHSPSRVFRDQIGKMISKGIAEGIEDTGPLAVKAIKKVGVDTFSAMQKMASAEVKELEKRSEEIKKAYNEKDKALKKQRNKNNAEKIDAQREALKEAYELDREALNEELDTAKEREKALTSFVDTYDKKMSELESLKETFAANEKKIQDNLAKDIEAANDRYTSAFESRVTSIKNGLKIFEVAEKGDAVKGKDLTKALKSQIDVLEDYNKALDDLSSKNVSEAFIEEMKGMGVDALPELEAINKMTDEELANYVALWEEKNRLATEAATEELKTMREETDAEIVLLRKNAETELEGLRQTYREETLALISELGLSMQEAGDAGLKELGGKISLYAQMGSNLMEGLADGIESEKDSVIHNVVANVLDAIDAAKEAAGIHSPSRVMRDEVGKNLGRGLSEGWHDELDNIKKTMSADLSGIVARVKATVSAENARMGHGVGSADTGFAEMARAVGLQTAGINSLAGEFRRGTGTTRPIIIQLDKRELGRAVVDVGGTEELRIGAKLALGGAV